MVASGIITLSTVLLIVFFERLQHPWIKKLFNWIPSILLAYLIPALVSYLFNRDFSEDPLHDWSKTLIIPLAVLSVMSSLSLTQLRAVGWKPIVVFLSGSFWIALFPVCILFFFQDSSLVKDLFIGQEVWKAIPPVVGSWIGGSTSQLVLKEVVACSEALFLTVLILDNILVNIWTIGMFQSIKKSDALNKLLKIDALSPPENFYFSSGKKIHPLLSLLLLLGVVFCVHIALDSFVGKIVVLSLVGLGLGFFIKTWNGRFVLKIGSILILIVMAILGLKLKFSLIRFDPAFFTFLVFWLASHFIFMLFIAKLLRVNTAWVPIASMANVGGIATAPAVTAAYKKEWMPHAIILAVLSMATGTFWGLLTIHLIRYFIY
ncbi:MAG: DUF819 family protein [Flavobacteriaceae bacterium]